MKKPARFSRQFERMEEVETLPKCVHCGSRTNFLGNKSIDPPVAVERCGWCHQLFSVPTVESEKA